jgi:hypothetical protein
VLKAGFDGLPVLAVSAPPGERAACLLTDRPFGRALNVDCCPPRKPDTSCKRCR